MLLCLLIFSVSGFYSQCSRISNYNTIGWYNYFGTHKLHRKWGIHTEYQWLRNHLITHWQQSLLRVGVNYQLNSAVQLSLGYAWIETFAYGDIPLNGFGKNFTEHRLFQMATITDKVSVLEISHRFILEQQWIGRYSTANLLKEDVYPLLHRVRYMFRFQIPLKENATGNKIPYVAVYDEIFLGFGKNVNENIFDQNRFGLLLGYRFSSQFRIEAGYLNQILQLGRKVNGSNVFQYNNGLIINTNFNFTRKTIK